MMETTKESREWAAGAIILAVNLARRTFIATGDNYAAISAGDACGIMRKAFADADRCAELEEQLADCPACEATEQLKADGDALRDRCADLEAQLQQSRDDYETALREGEKTTILLRATQHDANNASTLRVAAEFARSERDRVEGERDTARAEAKQYRELASKERSEWASADRENTRLRAGMEKVREYIYFLRTMEKQHPDKHYGMVADSLTEALSIAGVERG